MSMLMTEIQLGVRRKLGGRVDQNANLNIWIAETVLELAQSYSFKELLITGPAVPFQVGVNTYDRSTWCQAGDDWTDIKSWFLFFNSNSGPGWQLKGRNISFVDQYSNIAGIPAYWSEADGQNIVVGFNPNNNYYAQMRYQRVNPFTYNVDGSLAPADTDIVYLPNDWQEIIEYAAAIRAASELRAFDYVDKYYSLLHGDDDYRESGGTKGKPGLIFGRITTMQKGMNHFARQLKPAVSRY